MFKMIDVIGVSDKGYSHAVEEAVEILTEKGEKVHFFEVKEMRGALRQGIVEYQVKISVAVEI